MIVFDSASHTYTNSENGRIYISTTTLLGEYKAKFDALFHSKRVAAREGVSQEFVLEMWQAENKKATDKGTAIHKLLENYIADGTEVESYYWLYRAYDKVMMHIVDKYKSVKTENLLHNHEYEIAGTTDLIFEQGNYFTLSDFKTNKKFRYASDYNEYFQEPISHLSYCEFNDYSLQLSIYAYMYELLSGKKCKKLVVFHLKDDRFVPIHVNYMKREVIEILEHYKSSKKNK